MFLLQVLLHILLSDHKMHYHSRAIHTNNYDMSAINVLAHTKDTEAAVNICITQKKLTITKAVNAKKMSWEHSKNTPEQPVTTLTWNASKFKVHKLHWRNTSFAKLWSSFCQEITSSGWTLCNFHLQEESNYKRKIQNHLYLGKPPVSWLFCFICNFGIKSRAWP